LVNHSPVKLWVSIWLLVGHHAFATTAMTDSELKSITEQRLLGDRTGACFAVAVVDTTVARAIVCANPQQLGRISAKSTFEIGSVTKTMTAALLADLMVQNKASLDDPVSRYLPADAVVPNFQGQPILLWHLVTHTSGLPVIPEFNATTDIANPYAKIDESSLLKTLSQAKLARAPGSQYEYSNYAMMLLTSLLARQAGTDYETLLQTRLFAPLGMQHSYVNRQPEGADAAQGHTPNTTVAPAWAFQTNTAGLGGVRATLDDMVRYVQAQLGLTRSAMTPALQLTQQVVSANTRPAMGMNWILAPLYDHMVHVHEGGTGGFSAFTAFDLTTQRGVVILSDTALTSLGGLGSLGNHLLDARLPLGKSRTIKTPDAKLLKALVGSYHMAPGMQLTLTQQNHRLFGQATGQAKFEMGYDSEGDFFPLGFDAVLNVKKRAGSGYDLLFLQGGGAIELKKVDRTSKSLLR
jgi:serine-type D-Ala-D-Ala carboxypeptidase/endopeptidase